MGNALSFFKSQREEKITPEVEARIAGHKSSLLDSNGKPISGADLELNEEQFNQLKVANEREAKKWSVPPEGGNATKG